MDNRSIAERLIDYAHFLEGEEPNLYRVKAYRRAAEAVLMLNRPVADVVSEQGRKGLETLPGIGTHLSYTIEGLVRTGEFRTFSQGGGRHPSRGNPGAGKTN
jgi:DNA polymerase (family 10)